MHGDSLYSKYGGILLWTDFWFKILLKFKASMPLLANFIFRNGRFFVSIESQTLTALNSLFEEMSKIIPWSRCSGDPTSVKCKVSVDSYKTCSVFKGREYSLVRIWWREKGRDLTRSYDKSPYTNRNVKRAKWQHKQRHKKVRLNSGCGPT